MFSFCTCSASIMIKALSRQCLPCSQSQLKLCCIQLWKLWIGERDACGDLVGDWAQYLDKETFKCRWCDQERKYNSGGKSSLIQHSKSIKHKNIADGKTGRVPSQSRVGGKSLNWFSIHAEALIISGIGFVKPGSLSSNLRTFCQILSRQTFTRLC